jgi:hypothetical protein
VSKEQWTRWEPKINKTIHYFICSERFFGNSLEIFLSDFHEKEKDLKFTFNNSVFFYNTTDEGCRILRIAYFDKTYRKEFSSGGPFFKISNSEWLNWISSSSENEVDVNLLTHFVFVDDNVYLDVIASKEPEVIEIDPEDSLKTQRDIYGILS